MGPILRHTALGRRRAIGGLREVPEDGVGGGYDAQWSATRAAVCRRCIVSTAYACMVRLGSVEYFEVSSTSKRDVRRLTPIEFEAIMTAPATQAA